MGGWWDTEGINGNEFRGRSCELTLFSNVISFRVILVGIFASIKLPKHRVVSTDI
jgi:hypothetical protein